jgi:hypothetical protein
VHGRGRVFQSHRENRRHTERVGNPLFKRRNIVTVATAPTIIRAELPEPGHEGWNRLAGVTVDGRTLIIDTADYFFRYENPSWVVCDWDAVRTDLLGAQETTNVTVEQLALEYVKLHGRVTEDPAEVLVIASQIYSWLFRPEHLADPSIVRMGVTPRDLRVLREMGTMMALNRVELSGEISNVGPAWMFGEAAKIVFGLNASRAELVDELYHGSWFNEPRRVEQVKAHAALGGRLVHGCQSQVDMAGGCVAPFGVDIERFRRELAGFRDEWIQQVRACG